MSVLDTFAADPISSSTYLHHKLNIIGDLIPNVHASIFVRLIRHFQQAVDLLLVQAGAGSQLRESLIGLVPRFMDDVDIKKIGLFVEQRLAEIPKLVGIGLQHRRSGLVHESGRRMPGLNMLAEDELDLIRVFLLDHGEDAFVDRREHLFGELCGAIG